MLLKASLIFLNRVNSSSDIYFLCFLFFYFAFYCIVGLLAIFFSPKINGLFFNWSKAVILIHHSYGLFYTDVSQWNHINFSSWLIYFQTGLFVESSKNISLKYIYFLSGVHCKLPVLLYHGQLWLVGENAFMFTCMFSCVLSKVDTDPWYLWVYIHLHEYIYW